MTSGVLRDITNIKIARLAKQQSQFEKAKASLLDRAKGCPDSLSILVKGLKELGLDGKTIDASLHNIRLFQHQAMYDASIPGSLIQDCGNQLVSALDAKSKRFEFSVLFARLATEWADNPNDTKALLETIASVSDANNADGSEGYESIGREEMYNQRQEWESYVFSALQTDPAAIHRYLDDVFSKTTKAKRAGKTPLEELRECMASFGVDKHGRPALKRCTESDVRSCVKGVLQADLFTGKKRDTLLGLSDAHAPILKEIADVINGETSTLGPWQWQPSPIPVHMRRQLNGKYRVYMDPEIHQALLVHWVGLQFAIHLKNAFTSFFHSGAWIQSSHVSMTRQDKIRRKFYVPNETTRSVRHRRRETFQDDFFTTQLPSSISEGVREYDSEGTQPSSEKKSPLEVKQSLLHIATTEMLLQKKLYGKFTLVQTDFKWFGPSLPHSTIFAVLEFFHVPTYWIDFFEKFLAMPLVFPDDGPQAAVRTRKRGVPISHILADALGEMVLFCLDFAVNKATRGSIQLYRFHDDVWFWGQEDSCLAAWQAVTSFAKCMGMQMNEKKTGSFSVANVPTKNMTPLAGLPTGPVRWGFLQFDSSQSRWTIDMDCINEHITELRHQLDACRSIACWIQAWNSYVSRFF